MHVMRAFIHTVGGRPFNEECEVAWHGFEKLGVECVPFSDNDVLDQATRYDVVVGGMMVCEHALALQGVSAPRVDYPHNIREFLGREIDEKAVEAIRPDGLPVFVKPVLEKDLPGVVINSMDELAPYLEKGNSYLLYVSEPVKFVSEWRVFVRYRRILGVGHYQGDIGIVPDWTVAARAISHLYSDRPNGYGLDLGVTDDGRTLVVEVNDGFALGSYGLDDVAYALLLSARWAQLLGVPDELHDVKPPAITGSVANAMASQRWTDLRYGKPGVSVPEHEPDLPDFAWCVVANVRDYPCDKTAEQSNTARKGTKHFAPGTRVWVLEQYWSWDERVAVVGKKKGTHRYIRKVMSARQLENFRVKRVYSPTILSWMCGARNDIRNFSDCGKYDSYGDLFYGTYWDKKSAADFAEAWNKENAGSL